MAREAQRLAPWRQALDVLRGEWVAQPLISDMLWGRVVFDWDLRGQVLLQRSRLPRPEFGDSLAIIAPDPGTGGYLQHYFDSRGAVRLYAMGLRDGIWTLRRETADFTPLAHAERFEGRFSKGGDTIVGRWDTSRDGGEHWRLEFKIIYSRLTSP